MGEHPALVVARELRDRERRRMQEAQRQAKFAVQSRTTITALREADALEGRNKSQGRANLERFNAALEFLEKQRGLKLGYMQKQLMAIARIILLPRMFGESLPAEWHRLQLKYNLKRLYEQAAITLPRRAGKTVAQTLLAALVAVTQPDGNVCCFNLGSRQSKNWLSLTISALRQFKDSPFAWTLKSIESKERIEIINCCGTVCTISSYPGPRDADASNYRGVGDKLMLLLYDEFYFFKEVVYTTTIPLSKNGAAILMISSMSKNWDDAIRRMIFSTLEDGEEVFMKLDWLRACPECQSKGAANKCTHIEQRPQHFEPRGAMRRLKALMSPFGNDSFERELLNTAAKSTRWNIFASTLLAPLRSREMDYRSPVAVEYGEFFIGFDPAGVGDGFSQSILVSVVFDKLNPPLGVDCRCIVLAVESVPVRITEDVGQWMVRHALSVRARIPGLRGATAVFCIESNSLMIAPSVTAAIARAGCGKNMGWMTEEKKSRHTIGNTIDVRPGLYTTAASKEAMLVKMRQLLEAVALHFHPDFFIPHPESQPAGEGGEDNARKLFVDELANMCADYVQPKGPVASKQKGHITYCGFRADGQKATNDKVMALGFCLQCYPLYKLSPHLFMRTITH